MTQSQGRHLLPGLAVIGALAGLAGWALTEAWDAALLAERALLWLSAFASAGFGLLLGLAGPVAPRRALLPAALTAALLATALWSASGRHAEVASFMATGYPLAAFGTALCIAAPFLAAGLARPGGWRSYPDLFGAGWGIALRLAAAVFFAALFWGLLSLSDALLGIVDVPLLEWVTRVEALAWALTGAVLGLALAVLHRFSGQISPDLLLRLLRLFLPVVLTVTLVFLVALPLRGWEGLARGFSPAAVLLAMALAGLVLVTVALDRDGGTAVQGRAWRAMTGAMALCLPVMAGLAGWAVWLRVGQYGWTPERLMAGCAAAVLLAYGLAHALAVLRRRHWMARIREANIWMALAVLAVALLWLSPVFVPERIAAEDQVARARAGAAPETLALREMARAWGHPGRAALARLAEERPALAPAIAAAETDRGPAAPSHAPETRRAEAAAALPVYPGGGRLEPAALAGLDAVQIDTLIEACARQVTGGPGCALYRSGPERALLLQAMNAEYATLSAMQMRGGVLRRGGRLLRLDAGISPRAGIIALEALHAGAAQVSQRQIEVLGLDGVEIHLPE